MKEAREIVPGWGRATTCTCRLQNFQTGLDFVFDGKEVAFTRLFPKPSYNSLKFEVSAIIPSQHLQVP
jgi:hypothetical protein